MRRDRPDIGLAGGRDAVVVHPRPRDARQAHVDLAEGPEAIHRDRVAALAFEDAARDVVALEPVDDVLPGGVDPPSRARRMYSSAIVTMSSLSGVLRYSSMNDDAGMCRSVMPVSASVESYRLSPWITTQQVRRILAAAQSIFMP